MINISAWQEALVRFSFKLCSSHRFASASLLTLICFRSIFITALTMITFEYLLDRLPASYRNRHHLTENEQIGGGKSCCLWDNSLWPPLLYVLTGFLQITVLLFLWEFNLEDPQFTHFCHHFLHDLLDNTFFLSACSSVNEFKCTNPITARLLLSMEMTSHSEWFNYHFISMITKPM